MKTDLDADPAAAMEELTKQQERDLIDQAARKNLNMSGEEFAEKWHSGEFRGCDDPKVTQVAMLLPDAW